MRRMKAALGAAKAITATARKLAAMINRVLKQGMHSVDPGQDWYKRQYYDRLLNVFTRKAKQLGYQLVPITPN